MFVGFYARFDLVVLCFGEGSKVNYNIGKHDFWINNLKRARPQDAVVLDNERKGKFNHARMRY